MSFENRHEPRIAAYLVNSVVPRDQSIGFKAQKRSYSQSLYELEYVQAGINRAGSSASAWLFTAALLLLPPFVLLWRQRASNMGVRSK